MVDYGTDQLLLDLADYVVGYDVESKDAFKTARYAILDAIGCGLMALSFPECMKLLGPTVPGTTVHQGCRVPGTQYVLDPVQAAFNIATMNRWLEYNDTWLAAEWCHPSDGLAAVLAVADYLSQVRVSQGLAPMLMRDVIINTIKVYEIVGVLALENSLNQIGVDHLLFLKVAMTAVTTHMLGGGRREVANSVSQVFIDGSGLRCFRHYPNVGSRKAWASGDAASRSVWLSLQTMRGEMGYNLALSAPVWGFQDVFFRRAELSIKRELGTYVMENVLFRVAYPGEFHACTAVEAAFRLHPQVVHRYEEILSIVIHTTRSCIRCIDKTGPLRNAADRDHSLQYMVAIALLYGTLTAEHFEDSVAQDPRIDQIRKKMQVVENPQYSANYLDPDKRSVTNAVQVHFQDRTSTQKLEVEYPIGHRRRRGECFAALEKKFMAALNTRFPANRSGFIFERLLDPQSFDVMPVGELMSLPQGPPLRPMVVFGGGRAGGQIKGELISGGRACGRRNRRAAAASPSRVPGFPGRGERGDRLLGQNSVLQQFNERTDPPP